MAQAIQKLCCSCGKDVANQKRTKDGHGRYYCQPCYDSLAAQVQMPSDEAAYACSACGQTYAVHDVFDDNGSVVCKLCWKARSAGRSAASTPVAVCHACGTALPADAAFCARCGASTPANGTSISDNIDISEAVHWVSVYARAAGTLAKLKEMASNVETLVARGHQFDMAEGERMLQVVETQEAAAEAQALEAAGHLRKIDLQRLLGVRDQMLKHCSVTDEGKNGLRFDPLVVFGGGSGDQPTGSNQHFGSTQTSVTAGYTCSNCRHQFDAADVYDISGRIICKGCYATQSEASANADPMAALASAAVGRGSRRVAKRRPTPNASLTAGVPVGYSICLGMIVVAVILAIICVLQLTEGPRGFSSALGFGFGAVVVFIAAFAGMLQACPKCFRLFTAETTSSESLGDHVETRKEQRVAQHYNPSGGGVYSETRYEVDVPVHVQSFRHTKRCSRCKHVWQSTERRTS